VKPRAGDFVGALLLALVLFALVAVIFIATLPEAERIHREQADEAAVATRQL
jgi:hypothetical protein